MNFLADVNRYHFYIPSIPLLTGLSNTVRASMLKGLTRAQEFKPVCLALLSFLPVNVLFNQFSLFVSSGLQILPQVFKFFYS